MQIQFLGAAREVTGSCYLISAGDSRVLVECGQIQGSRKNEARNRDPWPIDIHSIDAVVLSHAHIDHSGRLPMLVKLGYAGPVYTHHATRALCDIMLRDSAYLHEKDAQWENKRRQRAGQSLVDPLFTQDDAAEVVGLMRGIEFSKEQDIAPGIRIRLQPAGHILGASIVEIWLSENGRQKKVVFSGDLGYRNAPIMNDPTKITAADLVLMESTYGDREHRPFDATLEELGQVFADARHEHGNILIPAFSVGRSQDLLHLMKVHYDEWGLKHWKVFLDSPMAIQATEVYARYRHLLATELFDYAGPIEKMPDIYATRSSKESMAINEIQSGAIIIAGSGMCTGGRILHHLKHNVWQSRCHVVIVGFQAHGSTGRQLVDGADSIRLWGETIRVNAKIHTVGGLSAHADQTGLIDWYSAFENRPPLFLVHGEERAQQALAETVRERFTNRVEIPELNQTLDLNKL